ncbi:MAG: TylF/MycF/NovP-related O-methyltransferase, partial [Rhizomicrobium sp.]
DLSDLPVFNDHFRAVVEKNIENSGLDPKLFVLVEGRVEDTLPGWQGKSLSYLRLDTDYFESTMVELEFLYPRLEHGGVLIIDDYGHFGGVRRAVDDFFSPHARKPLLQRVDYTGRCGIKI